jgi:hypothetical protein
VIFSGRPSVRKAFTGGKPGWLPRYLGGKVGNDVNFGSQSGLRGFEDRMMEYASVAADPFSILTVVVAPAVLTNASSVLALGTNNRLARVADRTHVLTAQLAKLEPGSRDQVSTAGLAELQTRAQLLLRALRCFYLGLGLFASSALISLAGSIVVFYSRPWVFQIAAGIGVACGASAVIALVYCCVLMISETRLAVKGLAYEAGGLARSE